MKVKQSIMATAEEVLGKERGTTRNHWFDEECAEVTERENEAYRKMQTRRTRLAVEEYQERRREEKRIHKAKKREYLNRELQEIENLNREQEFRQFYKKSNFTRKSYKPQTTQCKNAQGDLLSTRREVLDRWVEHFNTLLNTGNVPENEPPEMENDNQDPGNNEDQQVPPTMNEVREAIKKLANHKSPGSDNLPAELLKGDSEELIVAIYKLLSEIWTQKILPEEWKIGIICTIHKKGDVLECSNYRGITLLNAAYKVFSIILGKRIRPYAEREVGRYQAGFRGGKSTIHQISTLRQILEKTQEYGISTHHIFVDFKAAYDTIKRKELYAAMRQLNIPNHLVNLTQLTLEKVECRVRVGGDISEPFETTNGLRQGDALSCILFNIALEKVVRSAGVTMTGTIYNKSTQILAYADDIDIIGITEAAVTEAYIALKHAAREMGLVININKTKYMLAAAQPARERQRPLSIENEEIESVREFVYLGSLVNSQNDTTSEVKRRVLMANRCYFGLASQLSSQNISRSTKVKLYKTLIRPVLTYGSETWALTKRDENILGCFERKILRKIYGAVNENGGWRRRYNFELYRLFKDPDIVKTVKLGRLRWVGHVMRMEESEPARKTLLGKPVGQRRRGRPRIRFMDNVDSDLKNIGIRAWRRRALNRDSWKEVLEEAKAHNGL